MPKQRFLSLPTFGDIIFVVFSVGIFLKHDFLLLEGDTAWIIRTGEYIITTGIIPSHDLYSYTHPYLPWIVYQWGFEVIIGGAYKISGFHGAVWVCSIIIASTLLLFYKLLRLMGTTVLVAFPLTLLTGTMAALDWDVRPGIVSQLLFVATLFTLQEFRLTKELRVLYRLPLIFLIWANMHLGFVLGFVAIGFVMLERYLCFLTKGTTDKTQERREIVLLAIFLGICLLATLINPNSYGLIPYFLRDISLDLNAYIAEMQSPDFHDAGLIIYQLIFMTLIISLTFLQRKADLGMLFMAFGFLITSLHSLRYSPYFAFLSSIVIAQQLNPYIAAGQGMMVIERLYRQSLKFDEREKIFGSGLYSLAVAFIITLVVMSGYTGRVVDSGFSKEVFPVEACNFVKQHELPGNLYSDDYWGSYAIFSLYPRYKVFIDTRFDMYGDEVFLESKACHLRKKHVLIKSSDDKFEGPNQVFDKYQVNWILIGKEEPLAYTLKADKGWIEIYSDEIAMIFLRDNEANRVWLQDNLGIRFAT